MSGRTCRLCGVSDPDVATAIAAWKRGKGTEFEAIPRCRDKASCRGRVTANGERWPLVEGGSPC